MVPYYVYNRIGFPRLCNRLDRIVAVSPTVKGMYVENGINGQLVEIIPHFIETSFAGEGRKRRTITSASFTSAASSGSKEFDSFSARWSGQCLMRKSARGHRWRR